MHLGIYNSTLPTLTTGQSAGIQVDAKGQQLVDLNYIAGTALGVPTAFGTTPGAVVAASANASLFIGTTVASASAAGVQKVGISGNAAATLDGVITAATAPANGLMHLGIYNSTLPTLTTGQSAGIQVDAKGQQLVDLNYIAGTALGTPTNFGSTPGAVVAASANASLFVGTTAVSASAPVPTSSIPVTSGGCYTNCQQALTTSANVKASAGQIYGYTVSNPNASGYYVMWYNLASAPATIGQTSGLILGPILIPAGGTANVSFPQGIACGTGIEVSVATTATGSTAPGTGFSITTLYA
jgi:hypothetical protein